MRKKQGISRAKDRQATDWHKIRMMRQRLLRGWSAESRKGTWSECIKSKMRRNERVHKDASVSVSLHAELARSGWVQLRRRLRCSSNRSRKGRKSQGPIRFRPALTPEL